jgi:hypothetical protein
MPKTAVPDTIILFLINVAVRDTDDFLTAFKSLATLFA